MASSRRPWIDLHAHPGRFFLDGLPADDPGSEIGGPAATEGVPGEISGAGMTAVSFATVSDMRAIGLVEGGGLGFRREFDPGEAYADHRRQLAAARALAERAGFALLGNADDLDVALNSGVPRMFLACEGADFVEDDLGRIATARDAGVRSIQLVHYRPNAYGDLQTAPAVHGGLSPLGADVVREMNRARLLVDAAHASYDTTLGILRVSSQPIMVSHTHLGGGRREHPRLITREHARAVADSGGLIGAWPSGFANDSFDDFVGEISRLAEAAGIEHVAIGTDMDGNYRPVLTRYAQFGDLRDGLAARGFTPDEIDGVLGGNAARLIRSVCG